MGGGTEEGNRLSIEALKRADALAALTDGPMERSELMSSLDVSRTTIHRIVRGLEGHELLVEEGGELKLSTLGHTVAEEVSGYRRRVTMARRLRPFLETLSDHSTDFDIGLFHNATITESKPTNPYGPVARFMELLRDSETLRGFDTTTIAPIYVEDIRDEILGGMETDIVYLSAVVREIFEAYPEAVTEAVESGKLVLSTHDELPFGLAIFDDRVGIGGYDDTGLLSVFVDTDSPAAREWAFELYERYRAEADRKTVDSFETERV
ncbi:helix-turn-helix transcriptional regulator [Haloferax namakaokahaiae]|uniref:Helix-turn-helix transcriptional regulator n=1 Tax=Haloferax namakaokahaiae TaxID=1748331 RepID=A0ABD5ZCI4_9EURY